jgi:hypothetical protein
MRNISLILILVAFLAGCARKKVETAKDLQEVFDKPGSGGVALKSAPPELQTMVGQVVTAMEKQDEMTAVMTLRDLRNAPQLNDAQVLAVEDLMKKAYLNLGERAQKGDPQAIAALHALNVNRR